MTKMMSPGRDADGASESSPKGLPPSATPLLGTYLFTERRAAAVAADATGAPNTAHPPEVVPELSFEGNFLISSLFLGQAQLSDLLLPEGNMGMLDSAGFITGSWLDTPTASSSGQPPLMMVSNGATVHLGQNPAAAKQHRQQEQQQAAGSPSVPH